MMKAKPLKLGLLLLFLGLLGILSLLATRVPLESLSPEAVALNSPEALQFIVLINPFIITVIAIIAGVLLYERVGLSVPVLESFIDRPVKGALFLNQLAWSLPIGMVVGCLVFFFSAWFEKMLPEEFSELAKDFEPAMVTRFLYGGFTEEIILRFGLTTLLVWLHLLIFKKIKPAVYWSSILISAFLFGAGHLGVLFASIESPPAAMIVYIIAGNAFGGIFLGWLYWKKGLESAMTGHMFMHLSIIILTGIAASGQ
ncbi:MAG TPA: CPBP family intramembrane metalloprotease [Bacteroidaceae bacterium]|nr:CPBP family intramembrane metalloprotease [Bacteroidaceae bacterium]